MNTSNQIHPLNHPSNLLTQRILTLNTNKLIPRHKRIKRLALPPTIPHTHIILRLPLARLPLHQLAKPAKVDHARHPAQTRPEPAASHLAFFDLRAAAAHVFERFLLVVGHPGDVADVPDFELVVPDGFDGEGAGEGGGEGDEGGDEGGFEVHDC